MRLHKLDAMFLGESVHRLIGPLENGNALSDSECNAASRYHCVSLDQTVRLESLELRQSLKIMIEIKS